MKRGAGAHASVGVIKQMRRVTGKKLDYKNAACAFHDGSIL